MRTLEDFFAERPELATLGSNCVIITGPSRTADIEMTLSRGVHGPREIHVIVHLIAVPSLDNDPLRMV